MKRNLCVALMALGLATNALAESAIIELDGKKFAESDLPPDVRNALFDSRQEAFEKNVNELKQFAVRLALAKAKDPKVDPKKLPPFETLLTPKKPTDAEVQAFFEANKSKLPPDSKLVQYKADIARHLEQQSVRESFQAKIAELEKKGGFKVLAAAPDAPVVTFDLSAYPSRGPKDAAVTLVEASDYLCPHCQEEHPEVKAVLKEFGDKIRFVQVNYALRPDGFSGELARGAHCARQVNEEAFWKFHDQAFSMRLQQSPTPDRAKVVEVAKAAGLDTKAIEQCLATPEAKAAVDKTVAAMNEIGVTGTPTFFLNGKKLHTDHVSLKDAVSNALAGTKQSH